MQYGDKLYKPVSAEAFAEAAIWCNNNKGRLVEYTDYFEIAEDVDPVTYKDYDNAMEAYIKEIRVARGYTTREPSDYRDDPNPRYNQDAIDYISFRSQVMDYGLEVQNKFIAGEEVPTLDEFKEHLKTIECEWTYNSPYV